METSEKKKRKILKWQIVLMVLGFLLLAGGITMIVFFAISDTINPALIIVGCFLLVFAFIMLSYAFLPLIQRGMIKINKQIIEENKEDLKDISSTTGEIASEGVKKVAKSAMEGVNDADKIYCKHCGQLIDSDSKFCSFCGKEQ